MNFTTTINGYPGNRPLTLAFFLVLSVSCQLPGQTEKQPPDTELRTRSLGVSQLVEQIVLPGTRLTHKKVDPTTTPLIVRVVRSFPHGDSFRYDISYFGLTEGNFDLRDFLVREDGSSTEDLPSLPVVVNTVLAGNQIEPNQLKVGGLSKYGGYWKLLWLAGIAWVLGLTLLVFLGRPKKRLPTMTVEKPVTLAELLKPAVEKAIAGELPREKRAELERFLFSFWQNRLNLRFTDPAKVLKQIRNHPESGPLLKQVETWLHSPTGSDDSTNIADLLAPYQRFTATDLDVDFPQFQEDLDTRSRKQKPGTEP